MKTVLIVLSMLVVISLFAAGILSPAMESAYTISERNSTHSIRMQDLVEGL